MFTGPVTLGHRFVSAESAVCSADSKELLPDPFGPNRTTKRTGSGTPTTFTPASGPGPSIAIDSILFKQFLPASPYRLESYDQLQFTSQRLSQMLY